VASSREEWRAAAAQRWPELPAPDEAFDAVMARARGADDDAQLHAADLFVAHHALLGNARALAVVQDQLAQLRPVLRRTGAGATLIDELVAELPFDLLAPRPGAPPRLAAYAGRGPLAGWLRVVAVRTLVERRRRGGLQLDDGVLDELAAAQLGPELTMLRLRYRDELAAAVAAAVAALDPQHRLLLRQHYLDGLSIDRLAALHGIHRATAARRLASCREELAAAVRDGLMSKLGIGDNTLDSIVRLVGSELELGLDQYL
jgi:RNA polymerase sigma-70 factor (ECF subfamily)